MNTHEINQNKHILIPLIEKSLINSVEWTIKNCRKPQEPDYIAALSTQFAQNLFNILVAVFPNNSFGVSGIFCHQKPIANIGTSPNPELGDILFIYSDRTNRMYNSLLLQAKVTSSDTLRILPSESHQLKLYREWPIFTYSRASRMKVKRDILPKTITAGAQYLLIDPNPLTNGLLTYPNAYPMGCAIPSETLCLNGSLSAELINFLKFKAGRAFEGFNVTTTDDWTNMINDMLAITKSKMSRRKNMGLDRFPRSNDYIHLSTKGMKGISYFSDFVDCKESFDEFDDSEGISVVFIESGNPYREG